MLDDFLVRAILAVLGVALACGVLGPFLLWRRMAFFGDATAHATLLGVALGLTLRFDPVWGVLAVAIAMALYVGAGGLSSTAADTRLAVAAHGGLGLGLLALSLAGDPSLSPEAWLFGDILAVGKGDLALIWAGTAGLVTLVAWRWQALLTATLNPDLARASGVDADREARLFTLSIAVAVAVAIQVVGVLLITALLVLPAAAARPLARTPEAMAVLAVVLGALSALGGLWLSWVVDTPTGPSIVSAALALVLLTSLAATLRR